MRPKVLPLFLPILAAAQITPFSLNDPINLIAPATTGDATTVVFAAAMTPDAKPLTATNLFVYSRATNLPIHQLTNYTGAQTWTGVTSVACGAGVAAYAAAPGGPGGAEEVHLLNTGDGGDRRLATDKEGCIQALCAGCARPCVGPVHLTADAAKVLYAVARQQPFFVVNADGSGSTRLPVYQGGLAPSPKRVIGGGMGVFASSAPSGPTFAAAATDVWLINLDGTGLKQVTKFGNPQFSASNATISADGTLIAFESNFSDIGPGQSRQVWLARADGTGLRQLSVGTDTAYGPSMSSDGSVVTFLQGGQLMRVSTAPGALPPAVLVAYSTSALRDAVLSDDATQAVFSIGPPFASAAAVALAAIARPGPRTSLSVYAPRFLNANGAASAAGGGAPTPGSLFTVYGANLAAGDLTVAQSFPLPTSLGGISLTVNGQRVPLTAVTPWQINAQLPQTTAPGMAEFQVRDAAGVALAPVSEPVVSFLPMYFSFPFVRDHFFYSQAATLHAGTGIVADMDHPAAATETLEIYGVGLGVTNPMVDAGVASPSSPLARSVKSPMVQIAGRDATVTFAGLVPGLAGVYQVNVSVPAGVPPGIQTLTWWMPGGPVVNSASVAVR